MATSASRSASQPVSQQYIPKMHLPSTYTNWNTTLTNFAQKPQLTSTEKGQLSQLVRELKSKALQDEISNQTSNLASQKKTDQKANKIPTLEAFEELATRAETLRARMIPPNTRFPSGAPHQRSFSLADVMNQGEEKTSDVQTRVLASTRSSSSTNDRSQSLPPTAANLQPPPRIPTPPPETAPAPQLQEQTPTTAPSTQSTQQTSTAPATHRNNVAPRPSVRTVGRIFTQEKRSDEGDFVYIRGQQPKKAGPTENKESTSSSPPSPPLTLIKNNPGPVLVIQEPPSPPPPEKPATPPPAPPLDLAPPRVFVAPKKAPPPEEPGYISQALSASYDLLTSIPSLFSRRS